MKALSIDGAVSKLSIGAKNDDKLITCIYDIGMKQSETILPAIDYVLSKIELKPQDLDYIAIAIGPGSFTGLRLAISAAKAIEIAYNIPVYGISSLEMYAYPFKDFDIPVLSVIDANKNRYYAAIYKNDKILLKEDDCIFDDIIKNTKKIKSILICGPDRIKLSKQIFEINKKIKILTPKTSNVTTQALFEIAENKITIKEPSLKDFDGPVYLRASEAEIKKNEEK